MDSIPWLDANEWSVLASRAPDAEGGRFEIELQDAFLILVEQFHLVYLRLVEDERVVIKVFQSELPHLSIHLQRMVLQADAAVDVAIYPLWLCVVESQIAVQWLSIFHVWHFKSRMPADLEVDFLVIGVLYMPYDLYLITLQSIAYS